MADRRGSRFAFEALFLIGLAAALALAHLDALEIVAGMLLGWLVVAALEWAAWRGRPHYGSGMPPRYFVPGVNLPPAQPLEQVDQGYPGATRDEAPTWIASASLRAEVLGEWPLAGPVEVEEDDEDEPAFVASSEGADPWLVAELPAAPVEEADDADEPEEAQADAVPAVAPPRGAPTATARHRLDPLSDPVPRRRRFGRGGELENTGVIEVSARPGGARPLPGSSSRP
ncbi:MAG TPA: hypothetical protein VGC78_13220 [Gaiellaceae bacterium]|jgi:hypothetical protein